MNQFFYNIATTTWAIKHVLFEIDYRALTTHGVGKTNDPIGWLENTPQVS